MYFQKLTETVRFQKSFGQLSAQIYKGSLRINVLLRTLYNVKRGNG